MEEVAVLGVAGAREEGNSGRAFSRVWSKPGLWGQKSR